MSRVASEVASPSYPDRSGIVDGLLRYIGLRDFADRFRAKRSDSPPRFVWDPGKEALDPATIICRTLPTADPESLLASYVHAGARAAHVVFVGDTTMLSDDAYSAVLRKGALVHHTKKPVRQNDRRRVQSELEAFFDAQQTPVEPRYTSDEPYTYIPAPPKVSPEELRAFVRAAAQRDD